MNILKRYVFQVLFWLGIWCVIWISTGSNSSFIEANGPTFLVQIALLGLMYYTVPVFLLKNKLFGFFFSTLIIIALATYIGTHFGPIPGADREPIRTGRHPPFLGSLFFRQLLIMSVTCLSNIMIETFALAQQKQKSEALAKAELKENELKFLKMQINPHFLFNALNNIYALSVINSKQTQEGINNLSLMLRYVLYDCALPKVAISKELEYISNFIKLFKLKSSKAYNIVFTKEIGHGNYLIAPMLFIPFIENAFKHSGIEKRGDTFVNIHLLAKTNMIELFVENSIPSKPHMTDPHGGIGLQNVKRRLEILYPRKHKLDIYKTKTFHVKLKLDLL